MAFDKGVQTDPNSVIKNPNLIPATSRESNIILPDIVQQNPQMPIAKRNRQTISWRVPGLGKVDMYINPQSLRISEKKVIKTQRTKGGYIVQYWGSELTTISISGSTGSSSIEGINILRRVYLSEQYSFQQVAATLADHLQEYTSGASLSGIINQAAKGGVGEVIGGLVNTLVGGTINPPLLPTLGSLAVAVEMYYQGLIFKGFFTSFSVTESTSLGPGVFEYQLEFTVIDQRGSRNNFTSWARSPAPVDQVTGTPMGYNKADSNSVPLSYRGENK